jgi:TonB family protein
MVILEIRVGPDGSVEDAKVLRSIPVLDQAAVDAVMQWRFQPTLMNGQPTAVIMTVTVNFVAQTGAARGRSPLGAAGRPQSPEIVKEVKPSYTPEAMRARIEGSVEMQVVIDTDGSVIDARILRGLPMLNEQALIAVRQWQFKPLPQRVATNIEMTFTLRR